MIIGRSMALQPYVTCRSCGEEYIGYEDDEVCYCGEELPDFGPVGVIDAQIETISGRRLLVRAARHQDGSWSPIAKEAHP